MKIKYSPQRKDGTIKYMFQGEKIIVTYDGDTEIFDFSDFPNGRLEGVETVLPFNPVIKAERVDGELSVELLHFHDANATNNELFPGWQEV